MKEYCFDTSGFSTPLEQVPDDIYVGMWYRVMDIVREGRIAVNREIYDEMCLIGGLIGECINQNRDSLLLDLNDDSWDVQTYLKTVAEMQQSHKEFISEYIGGSPRTVCLNDISIIALAKSLSIPLVSMEAEVIASDSRKRKIPNVCRIEGVEHLNFNAFLRRERILLT